MEIRALSRAAHILAAVSSGPAGATLMEIVGEVSLSKATTYRFLQALLKMEYVRHEADGGTYHVGPALLRLGRFARRQEELQAAARPFLEALKTSTGETITLVVPSGDQRLTVDVALSDQELRAVPEVGALKPIHAGAAGKAMLAWLAEAELRELLPAALKPVTARTITALQALERELARVRGRGYATSVGETVFGQAASAAAIFGEDGKVLGAINVSGPAIRLPAPRLQRHGELVAAAAAKLSRKLGWRKPIRIAS